MIKINLVREGRAVRGAGAAPAATAGVSAAPANLNNIIILGLAAAGVLLALGYLFLQKRTLANKQEQVEVRKAEAQKLEAIIQEVENFQRRKDNLQSRIDLINQLKQNQRGPVRIMDRISQDLPDLVWLDNMEVNAGKITMKGRGLNPNAIANFVENIKNDPYFEEPELQNVTEASITPLVYSFDMNFGFTYQPKTPGAPGAPGTPATGGTPGSTPAGTPGRTTAAVAGTSR